MHAGFALKGKLAYDAAMTDNRDIDEILASLDTLLRENDNHHNAIASKTIGSPRDINKAIPSLETNAEPIHANLNEHHNASQSSIETIFNEAKPEQQDNVPRVVLTEDMMVDNPQVSLPLNFNSQTASLNDIIADAMIQPNTANSEPAIDNNEASEQKTAKPVAHLHKHQIEQLISLVSLDISEHLQQTLPKLIKESLHIHLADMQHESDENNNQSDDN